MSQIWITSDWHFGHDREFLWQPRGFKSIYEMNEVLIQNYNKLVAPEDDVYCLGDCMLGNSEVNISFIKQLKGNIHLIRGNHDSDARMELYNHCYNIVEICEGKFLNYKHYHFYLSHYPCIVSNYDKDKPLKSRTISLCGHSHTKNKFMDMDKGLIYHCEVDAHDNKPILLDNIIQEIKEYISE